jgi:hypothetical protein
MVMLMQFIEDVMVFLSCYEFSSRKRIANQKHMKLEKSEASLYQISLFYNY